MSLKWIMSGHLRVKNVLFWSLYCFLKCTLVHAHMCVCLRALVQVFISMHVCSCTCFCMDAHIPGNCVYWCIFAPVCMCGKQYACVCVCIFPWVRNNASHGVQQCTPRCATVPVMVCNSAPLLLHILLGASYLFFIFFSNCAVISFFFFLKLTAPLSLPLVGLKWTTSGHLIMINELFWSMCCDKF